MYIFHPNRIDHHDLLFQGYLLHFIYGDIEDIWRVWRDKKAESMKAESMKAEKQLLKRVKAHPYDEAMRYMKNAEDNLEKAGRDGQFYLDEKYTRTACGVAYLGMLTALDAWISNKGISLPNKKDRRKSIEFYQDSVNRLDGKMSKYLKESYKILHLWGYYDGISDSKTIASGLEMAQSIIDKIKPQETL
ncbi:hypothetical protein AGMMS49938_19010 [Fibrobacterales bacterium]|nr:hypothetical protein AGMMS49938_19010 [Fibrobacterales bacterium]